MPRIDSIALRGRGKRRKSRFLSRYIFLTRKSTSTAKRLTFLGKRDQEREEKFPKALLAMYLRASIFCIYNILQIAKYGLMWNNSWSSYRIQLLMLWRIYSPNIFLYPRKGNNFFFFTWMSNPLWDLLRIVSVEVFRGREAAAFRSWV